MNKSINGLQKYKVAVLAALVAVVVVIANVVVRGNVHTVIALARALTLSHYGHFTSTVTHSHFRPFITTTFGHSTIATGNTTATSTSTKTPIKHVIVIFQENNSFDHYFGTYPHATNKDGSHFTPAPNTPSVNNLEPTKIQPIDLLKNNPNKYLPQRIDPHQSKICSPLHEYIVEQKSYHGGKMDQFVENDGSASLDPTLTACKIGTDNNVVMDYYDGNTVTAIWNYAQHFAMSDHFYQSTFGESTPQHINLVSGNTHGAYCYDIITKKELPTCSVEKDKRIIPAVVDNTLLSNVDPEYDICSDAKPDSKGIPTYEIVMTGKNIGELLTDNHISWGWFSGGFKLPPGGCKAREAHDNFQDYYPDVDPFQYYKSTANPQHLPPTKNIGDDDPANHQYSLSEFWDDVKGGHMPDVIFIKAPTYQQGHPGLSDPIAEQTFLVNTINDIEKSKQWPDTTIILTWDDSGGFYDHLMPPIVSPSDDPKNDALYVNNCNPSHASITHNDKCGYGPRVPLLIISPYAKENFVEDKHTDLTSILKFIEDNWNLGQIGGGSLDAKANSLDNLFDFTKTTKNMTPPINLDYKTGECIKKDCSF
jgi:phospholipase C